MTGPELRALLLEQGAEMAQARFDGWEADERIAEIKREYDKQVERLVACAEAWAEAATVLMPHEDEIGAIPVDEQWDLFAQGCESRGLDPEHAAFEDERRAFKRLKDSDEQRLLIQLPSAHLN